MTSIIIWILLLLQQLEISVDTVTHIMPLVPGENSLTLNLSRHQIKVHYGTTNFTIKQTPSGDPWDWLAEWDKGLFLAFGGVMGKNSLRTFSHL